MNDTATEPAKRGPGRPRTHAPEEAPRKSLRERLRGAKRMDTVTSDKFYVDPRSIPEGVAVEWKRFSVTGMEDPFYVAAMRRQGWEPMIGEDFPNLVPEGHQGAIIKEGMMLMGRPKELSDTARAELNSAARQQVKDKEAQLGATPDGTMQRVGRDLRGQSLGVQKEMMRPVAVEE